VRGCKTSPEHDAAANTDRSSSAVSGYLYDLKWLKFKRDVPFKEPEVFQGGLEGRDVDQILQRVTYDHVAA